MNSRVAWAQTATLAFMSLETFVQGSRLPEPVSWAVNVGIAMKQLKGLNNDSQHLLSIYYMLGTVLST